MLKILQDELQALPHSNLAQASGLRHHVRDPLHLKAVFVAFQSRGAHRERISPKLPDEFGANTLILLSCNPSTFWGTQYQRSVNTSP